MPPVKLAALAVVAALLLCACGSAVKPASGRGRIDDPRTFNPNRLACLRQHGLSAQTVGRSGLQIGSSPGGPSVHFEPTPGAAQAAQIEGEAQPAEVIGSALLYPHHASGQTLTVVENCLAEGVSG